MGRLIDADKLKAQVEAHEIIKEFSITEYECGHNEGICKAVNDIEDAETVEAIPVDWIKEYIDVAEEIEGFAARFVVASITGMLDAWKEEQEGG